jgi:hypothetical protein
VTFESIVYDAITDTAGVDSEDNNMSKTRLNKPGFSAKSVLTIMLIAASSASYAAESIDQLATRIGMDHFRKRSKRVIAAPLKRCRQKAIKTDLPGCSSKLTLR